MRRFAILGNAGSGKSTLAAWLATRGGLVSLDLDSVAWEPEQPAVRRPIAMARAAVKAFCGSHQAWVVEGCYSELVEEALAFQPRLIFLDPGFDRCLAKCRSRPWEPHKYATRAEQDAMLGPLLAWVAAYESREDSMSLRAHQEVFARYAGPKVEFAHQPRLEPPDPALLEWLR